MFSDIAQLSPVVWGILIAAVVVLAAAVVRWSGAPRGVAALAYAGYQLWLAVWLGGVNVFTRILLAFPLGLVTAFAVAGLMAWAIRKAAIDEFG